MTKPKENYLRNRGRLREIEIDFDDKVYGLKDLLERDIRILLNAIKDELLRRERLPGFNNQMFKDYFSPFSTAVRRPR